MGGSGSEPSSRTLNTTELQLDACWPSWQLEQQATLLELRLVRPVPALRLVRLSSRLPYALPLLRLALMLLRALAASHRLPLPPAEPAAAAAGGVLAAAAVSSPAHLHSSAWPALHLVGGCFELFGSEPRPMLPPALLRRSCTLPDQAAPGRLAAAGRAQGRS